MDKQTANKLTEPVTDQDHAMGSPAPVATLVEYGDYQCKYTRAAHPIIKEIQRRSGDWVQYVFRHFPQEKHEHARLAAQAAEAAGGQGMFWEMHNYLFESQGRLDRDSLIDAGEMLGLDVEQFVDDLDKHSFESRIVHDMQTGKQSQVRETPTFFINGTKYEGQINVDAMLGAIEQASEEMPEEERLG